MNHSRVFVASLFLFSNVLAQVVEGPPSNYGGFWFAPDGTQHWDFTRPADSNGDGRGPGTGPSPGTGSGPSSHGMGPGIDIAGMKRLSQSIERSKKINQEIEQYKTASHRFYMELSKNELSVFTEKDLKDQRSVTPLNLESAFDEEDRRLLRSSGQAIVMPGFVDYTWLTNIFQQLGFPISLATMKSEGWDKFSVPWMLSAVGPVEAMKLDQRVLRAIDDTEKWTERMDRESTETFSRAKESFQTAARQPTPRLRPNGPRSFDTKNEIHRKDLAALQDKLESTDPRTPQGRTAKYIGQYALSQADGASLRGDLSAYRIWYELGVTMSDIALGMVPVVGTAKDLWEAITGQSILTGERLTDQERFVAGVSAVSLGVAGFVARAIKGGVKTSKAMIDGVQAVDQTSIKLGRGSIHKNYVALAPKMAKIAEAETFAGFKAVRVIPGTGDKIAIVGRSMDAVSPYSSRLERAFLERGINVKPETFSLDSGTLSQKAADSLNFLRRTNQGRLSDEQLKETLVYRENRSWAQKLRDQDYTIVDLGNPFGKEESIFYNLERRILGL